MSDDMTSPDDEATVDFEMPDWPQPSAQSDASELSAPPPEEEATMALALSDIDLERGIHPGGLDEETDVKEEAAPAESDESTMMLDVSDLRLASEEESVPLEPDCSVTTDAPLQRPERHRSQGHSLRFFDDSRAQPFRWDRLAEVSVKQCAAENALSSAIGPSSMESVAEALARRFETVVGREHQVSWRDIGEASMSAGSGAEEALWAWGRIVPGQRFFAAGIDQNVADAWVNRVGGAAAVGDDFERGLTTFVIAEGCAELCAALEWPALSWAVNPLRRADLKAAFGLGYSPVVELVFDVVCESVRGVLRLWLNAGFIQWLEEAQDRREKVSIDEATWWRGWTLSRPLIAGSTVISAADLKRLAVGDVVVVKQHGVTLETVEDSARDGGAQYRIGRRAALTGNLVGSVDGRWRFAFKAEETMSDQEDVDVSQDQEGGVSVEPAELELEVRLGSVEMALGDVAKLRPGQVVDCDRPVGSTVELVVRGAQVARGELVSVDGRLGVRVLSVSAAPS